MHSGADPTILIQKKMQIELASTNEDEEDEDVVEEKEAEDVEAEGYDAAYGKVDMRSYDVRALLSELGTLRDQAVY